MSPIRWGVCAVVAGIVYAAGASPLIALTVGAVSWFGVRWLQRKAEGDLPVMTGPIAAQSTPNREALADTDRSHRRRQSGPAHPEPVSHARAWPMHQAHADGGDDVLRRFDVPALMEAGRWDEARLAMQKLAYEVHKDRPDQLKRFTALATEFARVDPLFRRLIRRVEAEVTRSPGIRQTAVYPLLSDASPEEVRYVAYFGELLGYVQRRKRGNTYELFPAGMPMPPIQPKAKARRKASSGK